MRYYVPLLFRQWGERETGISAQTLCLFIRMNG